MVQINLDKEKYAQSLINSLSNIWIDSDAKCYESSCFLTTNICEIFILSTLHKEHLAQSLVIKY